MSALSSFRPRDLVCRFQSREYLGMVLETDGNTDGYSFITVLGPDGLKHTFFETEIVILRNGDK